MHLLLSIGLGVYAIVHNFKDAPKYIDECASGSEDPSVLQSCQDGSKLFKGIMIAVFVVVWLLEICQIYLFHFCCYCSPFIISIRGLFNCAQLRQAAR